MTTFLNDRVFKDIVMGQWRPINFQKVPFFLIEPLETSQEFHYAPYEDKVIALWKLQDLELN
jgi:hypothetical protein